MNEQRLLEIASTISTLNGPLVILGYLSSLSESDMYLFLKYVKASKYRNENFYEAVRLFSRDYIEEKMMTESSNDALEFGYKEGNYEDYFINSGFSKDYFDNYMAKSDAVKSGKSRK